jgi:hypothetical protein
MKSIRAALFIMSCGLFLFALLPAAHLGAEVAVDPPEIVISQFKVTSKDGQYFMLFNSSEEDVDMGTVQLVYYNNYDFSKATSSKIIGLTGRLPAKGYYLVNDGPLVLCHQLLVNSVSMSFSTTAGSVQVSKLEQSSPGAPVTSVVKDSVSWSKSDAAGAVTLPEVDEHLRRNPVDTSNNPIVDIPGDGSWQVIKASPEKPCEYISTIETDAQPVASVNLSFLASVPPPVTVLSVIRPVAVNTGPVMPASNANLMAPVVNEVLPNPASPQLDAEDEFVELYNPNSKPFDLTGFYLETGTTTKRKWKFPDGTILKSNSFTAFYSSQYSVSLTNSGGDVRLLDPFENAISSTKEYGTAKDGYAWALAAGEWYWTVQPTPGKQNVITAGTGGSVKSAGAISGGSTGDSSSTGSASGSQANVAGSSITAPEVTTLHPSSLASVAVLAVGYGAYEYKQDIANRMRQFRSQRAASRKASGKS